MLVALGLVLFAIAESVDIQDKVSVRIVEIKDCGLSPDRYGPARMPYAIKIIKYNRTASVITGNITVPEKIGPIFTTVHMYQVVNGKKRQQSHLMLDRMTCDHPILSVLIKYIRLKVDDKCYVHPGSYVFDDLSLDALKSEIQKIAIAFGRFVVQWEFTTNKALIECATCTIDVIANKPRKMIRKI